MTICQFFALRIFRNLELIAETTALWVEPDISPKWATEAKIWSTYMVKSRFFGELGCQPQFCQSLRMHGLREVPLNGFCTSIYFMSFPAQTIFSRNLDHLMYRA